MKSRLLRLIRRFVGDQSAFPRLYVGTASRSALFSSARVDKMINVDGRRVSSNAESQKDLQHIADGDDLQEFINTLLLRSYKLQEFIDNSDLSTLHFYKLNSVNYATYSAYYGTVKLVVI